MARGRRGIIGLALGIAVASALAAMPGMVRPPAASAAPEVTRRAKVDLLVSFEKRFGGSPELLILGSSRAMRADPAQLRSALHLRTFNAAVSSGTVPDAYAFLRLAQRRYPERAPAVLWFLDVESMRLTGHHPYLLSVKRLAAGLPPSARRRPVSLPKGLAAGAARGVAVVRPRWHRDGLLVSWWHDRQRAQGRTTAAGVRYHQRQLAGIYRGGWPGMSGSAKWYATQIVRRANEMGVAPVVVLTPYHPQLRSFIARRGWQKARRDVRHFLDGLSARFELSVVDLTGGATVDGRTQSWYDGVHPRAGQMRRIVAAVLRRAGDDLVAAAATLPAAAPLADPFQPPDESSVTPGSEAGLPAEVAPPWPRLLPALPSTSLSGERSSADAPAATSGRERLASVRIAGPTVLPSTWPLVPAPGLL